MYDNIHITTLPFLPPPLTQVQTPQVEFITNPIDIKSEIELVTPLVDFITSLKVIKSLRGAVAKATRPPQA